MRPKDIFSPNQDIDVQKARELHHVNIPSQPSWQQQAENQKKYEASNSPFQKNQFVYLDQPQTVFNKSFHVQVSFPILLCSLFLSVGFGESNFAYTHQKIRTRAREIAAASTAKLAK